MLKQNGVDERAERLLLIPVRPGGPASPALPLRPSQDACTTTASNRCK